MARKTKKDPVEGVETGAGDPFYSPANAERLKRAAAEMDVSVSVLETHETAAEVRARNKKVRHEGGKFEDMILAACAVYRERGVAEIDKVPEPRKVVGRTGGRTSAMICINAAKAHPDFMGSVAPEGKCIVFDAKHTDKDRIQQNALTENQTKILRSHQRCGADCFVAVSFEFEDFFLIPFGVWDGMKDFFGRKYILPTDDGIQQFRVESTIGKDDKGKLVQTVWFLGA